LLPSLPPSDARRALLAAVAPATTVPIAMGAGPRQTRGKRQAEAVAEVVNDPAAATVAVAGNREGRQQSTTSSSTLILHDIITV